MSQQIVGQMQQPLEWAQLLAGSTRFISNIFSMLDQSDLI